MSSLNLLLLALFVATALWTVVTPTLLRAAIALAITSAMLTLLMFQMDAPLAGVFELSVCAGLITVVFISTISLTRRLKGDEEALREAARSRRFLPVLAVAAWVGALLWASGYHLDVALPPPPPQGGAGVREVLWGLRRLDLIGQAIMLFVGVFGVVILFKERLAARKAGTTGLEVVR